MIAPRSSSTLNRLIRSAILFLACGMLCSAAPKPAGPALDVTPLPPFATGDNRIQIGFEYQRHGDTIVQALNFGLHGTNELYELDACVPADVLAQINRTERGRVTFPIAMEYLPKGRYRAEVAPRLLGGGDNGALIGNGMIYTPADVTSGEITLTYRFLSQRNGQHVFLRCPSNVVNNASSWNFYYVEFGAGKPLCIRRAANSPKGKMWDVISNRIPVKMGDGSWHTLSIHIKDHRITAVLDDTYRVEGYDPDGWYDGGGIGFWQGESACVIDDLSIVDAAGETVFSDDFQGGRLGDNWRVSWGDWSVTPGPMVTAAPTVLGHVDVPPATQPRSFPMVVLEPREDSVALTINGRRVLPLILAFSNLRKAYDVPSSYGLPRRAMQAGVPILSPVLPSDVIRARPDGTLDYSKLDGILVRLATTCPDAWLLPRMALPEPPACPPEEIIAMAYGSDRPIDRTEAGVALRRYTAISTASATYRDFVLEHAADIVEHLRAQPYAPRLIGMNVCGVGYEGNWTPPRKPYGTIDASPAMRRLFGRYLRETYGSAAAVARAWNRNEVDLTAPPIPDVVARTTTDRMGFCDPAPGSGCWVIDWNEFYSMHIPRYILWPLFDRLHAAEPNLLWGRFGLFAFPGPPAPMVDHPGQDFTVGCLTYGDRKAGGISLYTNAPWESLRLRRKLALAEADIRTVKGLMSHRNESTHHDTIQTMRREFGHALLVKRMALWYYDMQNGWFDDPLLLAEMNAQSTVGVRLIDLPSRNVSEMCVVVGERGFRSGGGHTDTPTEPGDRQAREARAFVKSAGQFYLEKIMRVGAPRDVLLDRDLLHPDVRDYKLYVFPFQFYAPQDIRREIHRLAAEQGKTVLLVGGAGISTSNTLDIALLRDLTGMDIEAGELGSMTAHTVDSPHPLLSDLAAGTALGSPEARGRRFRVTDSDAEPLAVWDDGSTAVAVKPMGAGRIIYAAMPILQPTFYRNALIFAGGHVWTSGDDAFYADNHFIVIHTRRDGTGPRQIHLPHRSGTIYDLVTGNVVGVETDRFNVDLLEKTTGIWYYGDEPERVRGLRLGVIPPDARP